MTQAVFVHERKPGGFLFFNSLLCPLIPAFSPVGEKEDKFELVPPSPTGEGSGVGAKRWDKEMSSS